MKKLFSFLKLQSTPEYRAVQNYISETRYTKNPTYIIDGKKGYFTIDGSMKKFIRYEDAWEVARDINKGILGLTIISIQWQVYQNNKVNNEYRAIV